MPVLLASVMVVVGALIGLVAAGLSLTISVALPAVLVCLIPLATFPFLLDITFSRSGLRSAIREWADSRSYRLFLMVGVGFGLCLGSALLVLVSPGLSRFLLIRGIQADSRWLLEYGVWCLVPAGTLAACLVVLIAIDFFASGSPSWGRIRRRIAESFFTRLLLVGITILVDVALYSLVFRNMVFLTPILGILAVLLSGWLLDYLLSESRIWAVARHMIAEGIRMKIALVFIGIIILVLPVLPFIAEGDGVTIKSRVQSFLAYSLGMVGFFLSLLTVFLSCGSLANEIRQQQIFMVVCKPIPRWQFFVGKWLGISALNAALLLATGVAVWGFTTLYLQNLPETVPGDRAALQAEVLSVRYAARLEPPDFVEMAENGLRQLRENGKLEDLSDRALQDRRRQMADDLQKRWRTLGPGDVTDYKFPGLLVDRDKPGWLHLHFKPISPSGTDYVVFNARWQCGDFNQMDTLTPVYERDFVVERYHTVPVPTSAVNSQGTLHVRIANLNPQYTVMFEGDDSFELLYDIGTFHWNLFRALSIIWCRLAFLAAVGLLASSFVSFPVACMACFLVLLVASSAGFLADAIQSSDVKMSGEDPLWVLGPVLRPLGRAFVWLVPDFSKFDPVETVVGGRVVPLKWVLISLINLVFFKGLVLGVLGCAVFTKRELAQVVT